MAEDRCFGIQNLDGIFKDPTNVWLNSLIVDSLFSLAIFSNFQARMFKIKTTFKLFIHYFYTHFLKKGIWSLIFETNSSK